MSDYEPNLEEFKSLARQGNLVPLWREMLADLETPVSALIKISSPQDPCFLLESVEGGEKWARYSFLGSHPQMIFRSKGRRIELVREGGVTSYEAADPLRELEKIMACYRPVPVGGLPRFFGGAVGYIGYDTIRFFERLPEKSVDDLGTYDLFLILTDTLLVFDSLRHKIKVISNAYLEGEENEETAYQKAVERIEDIITQLHKPLDYSPPHPPSDKLELSSNLTPEQFESMVKRSVDYIRAGDVIQVVVSQRIELEYPLAPLQLYRALRTVNPSPYMFYLQCGDHTLVGSSPEVLVRLEEGKIELRPIAGTRPRGEGGREDRDLERELLSDPKERAEHIMLVDLGRNDVGRVAEYGSVKVDELMVVERYSHVMHIVSDIEGRLRNGESAFDLFRACFPAGTVSGSPKIRAMEIIEELEPTRRGVYAGAVGYFSFLGNMDMGITIRTFLVKEGRIYIQVGAGIVADSIPESEYQETWNKARGLIQAVELSRKIF